MPSNTEYELREAQEYQKQIRETEKAPLSERNEAASEFLDALRNPTLVAERIDWIIEGNYGYGAMQAAKRVLGQSARANKIAQLSQMVAALEWRCPPRAAVAAWKKLSAQDKKYLEKEIEDVIRNAEKE